MFSIQVILSIITSYLLGSIPTAYLVCKRRGIDIFSIGTGNPGAGNTFRKVGKREGFFVFLVDTAKGYLSLVIVLSIFQLDNEWLIIAGTFSIIGHLYSVFTKFRGGGGLATLIGVSLYLLPKAILIGAVPTILLLLLIRDAVWSSIVGFVVAAITDLVFFKYPQIRIVSMMLIGVILLIRMLVMEYFKNKRGVITNETG